MCRGRLIVARVFPLCGAEDVGTSGSDGAAARSIASSLWHCRVRAGVIIVAGENLLSVVGDVVDAVVRVENARL